MIERIRLRNFRRHRDATLRFQPGLNFIEGPNNVGKTSVFYAIEYAFFGRVDKFKTIRSLMQPGKRSIGVELAFVGKTGERFLLQGVHVMPPKSKKTLDGHFTLKAISDDGESYLLASDFGDTEDKLALMLHELTGLTRRLFSVACTCARRYRIDPRRRPTARHRSRRDGGVHGRGRTSANGPGAGEAIAGLAVLEERLRSLGVELAKVAGEQWRLLGERQTITEKLAALGNADDPRGELERKLAPMLERLAAHEARGRHSDLAGAVWMTSSSARPTALQAGSGEDADKELTKLDADAAVRAKTGKKLRTELDGIDAERRTLDQQQRRSRRSARKTQGIAHRQSAKSKSAAPRSSPHTGKGVAGMASRN